jgi:AcrR family transcriptional regulator
MSSLPAGEPKWRRRKQARPAEILAAAITVFAEKGFAAARLDDIARKAGVSKGALYLYFETKEDLFRAVVQQAIAPNVEAARQAALTVEGSFAVLLPAILGRFATVVGAHPHLPAVVKMVIAESRNFPELARIWHDQVISQGVALLSGLIERAQAKGEVIPGDPRLFAFSFMGPLLLSVIWRETFEPVGAAKIDLEALIAQHVKVMLGGMLARPG